MQRVGIYAGTFDPVHAGHIAFALQAIEQAQLDVVYFLPERRPRYKKGVEHFAHRVAMLKAATKPHTRLQVLELEDVSFTPERTMRRLRRQFGKARIVFLFGSDVVPTIPQWQHVDKMLAASEFVIGLRSGRAEAEVRACITSWHKQPLATHVLASCKPHISSTQIREALRARVSIHGLLSSVVQYSNRHWLYVSIA